MVDALVVWLVILALGATMPFSIAAFVALTVDVLAAVPLTPGGVGQIDAAYAGLLALLPLVRFQRRVPPCCWCASSPTGAFSPSAGW